MRKLTVLVATWITAQDADRLQALVERGEERTAALVRRFIHEGLEREAATLTTTAPATPPPPGKKEERIVDE